MKYEENYTCAFLKSFERNCNIFLHFKFGYVTDPHIFGYGGAPPPQAQKKNHKAY